MRVGIDFGTSYSSAGAVVGGKVQLLKFGDEKQFRTTAFFREQTPPDPSEFIPSPALELEVSNLVRASQNQQAREIKRIEALIRGALSADEPRKTELLAQVPKIRQRSVDEMRKEAVMAVRRSWLETEVRQARKSPASIQNAIYGDQAILAYLNEGGGHLLDSPKSMLGFKLENHARTVLQRVATYIFEHIRLTAVRQYRKEIRSAVIGRPVKFRSLSGEAGERQALAILSEAASAAGFDEVEFLEEPSAAAMGYHRSQTTPQRCLVVDVGGGTTDVAMTQLGGRAAVPKILGTWGAPLGGQDVDWDLSLQRFMPLFGKDLTRIPVHMFSYAACVHDLHRQRDFMGFDFSRFDQPYAKRLSKLQKFGNTLLLNWQVEYTKRVSGNAPKIGASLAFIENGLISTSTKDEVAEAAARYLHELTKLLDTARAGIERPPEVILLTGGMSQAWYVQEAVKNAFPGVTVKKGDASLGVVTGLALAAGRRR